MFIPKFFPFMSSIDDEGDNGGGDDPFVDPLGVPDDVVVEPVNQEDQQQDNSEIKIDPNWQKVLDTLPNEFHKQVLPTFKEWDTNFAKVQSDFAPYKPLLENKVPYEAIQQAFQLAELVSSDPQAVYEELGRRFGFGGSGQGPKQVEEEDDLTDDPNYDPSDISKNPQFVQLQQQLQQLQGNIQQQSQQEMQRREEQAAMQEINTEWSAIESRTGKLSDDVRTEITRRAIFIGDSRGDGKYSLEEGYKDYAAFVNKVRNSRANATAPAVLSGNGGIPQSKKNLGNMDDDERIDYIASFAERIAKENQ